MKSGRQDRSLMQQYGRYMTLALQLPAATVVGYILGYYLDKWLGTHVLYLIFLLLGIGAGVANLIVELNREDSGGKS